MTTQPLEDIFRSQVQAGLVRRDVDAFMAHFAPDCIVQDMSEPEARAGHDAVREWFAAYLEKMLDTEVEYLKVFGDANFVLGEFVLRGLYRGAGAGPHGTYVTLRYCVIDEFSDGLVQRETVYSVAQELDQQLCAATRSVRAE